MWQSSSARVSNVLWTCFLLVNCDSGSHWQHSGGLDIHTLQEPPEGDDGRLSTEPGCGWFVLPLYSALLGRRLHLRLDLWQGPLQNRICHLQNQLLQQHVSTYLHQRWPLHSDCPDYQSAELQEGSSPVQQTHLCVSLAPGGRDVHPRVSLCSLRKRMVRAITFVWWSTGTMKKIVQKYWSYLSRSAWASASLS